MDIKYVPIDIDSIGAFFMPKHARKAASAVKE